MIEPRKAIKLAIDLLLIPTRVQHVRSSPLPEGMELLLRIAAGDDHAMSEAAKLTGRSQDCIGSASAFFIEQILLAPDADSYRILGSTFNATASELRCNMALLIRWLHPDLDRGGERSIFIARVTGAWDDLKTPERRAAYDAQLVAMSIKFGEFQSTEYSVDNMSPTPAEGSENSGQGRSSQRQPGQRLRPYKIKRAGAFRRAVLSLFGRGSR